MIYRIRLVSAVLFLASGLMAGQRPDDKGETAEARKLRDRATAPTASDIDASATLATLLSKKDKAAFSESRGATVEGVVVQVEREEDGDYHVVLAPKGSETDTRNWLIVEVTPAWQKKSASLAPSALRGLTGKTVRATGWLYYEPDEESADPRGTRWEIHPVTELSAAK